MAEVTGIDDAGKGPIIGPMVMAGVIADEKDFSKLKEIGVADSKLLTAKKRELLYDQIIKIAKNYKIIIISIKEIDEAVASETTNLNWLEGEKVAEIINYLKPKKVIVDCPSPNIKAFSNFVYEKLKVKTELICDHKAERFIPVAAASILAKVTRDKEIEKLHRQYGNLGSGYPSDPKTVEFLKKNWNRHPEIFRKTWETYKKVADTKKQKNLSDY